MAIVSQSVKTKYWGYAVWPAFFTIFYNMNEGTAAFEKPAGMEDCRDDETRHDGFVFQAKPVNREIRRGSLHFIL